MEDWKRQLNEEFYQLISEWNDMEDQVIKRLKEEGKWAPGLDSNRNVPELKSIDEEYKRKIKQLKNKYREQYHLSE